MTDQRDDEKLTLDQAKAMFWRMAGAALVVGALGISAALFFVAVGFAVYLENISR